MPKLSGLPTETTITLSDLLVKVKAAGAGDVNVTFQNILTALYSNGVWWQELGRHLLGASATTLTASFTAKKYLHVLVFGIATGGNIASTIRFNNDSGSNYALRLGDNAAPASTFTSQSGITADPANNLNQLVVMDIINMSAQEKLVQFSTNMQGAAGAGNVTSTRQGFPKWANTSAPITRIDSITSSNNYAAGSELIILGHD